MHEIKNKKRGFGHFDFKVPIKENLKTGLIFGLQSRLAIAEIIAYLGFRHEVIPLMLALSHATRAYIVNANGLDGFLVDSPALLKLL